MSPHTVNGASNSKNIGCSKNICFEVVIKYFMSCSDNSTSFPGVL